MTKITIGLATLLLLGAGANLKQMGDKCYALALSSGD